jgi:dTDP-4-amino-4,6-dideoxygalactose transaminase
MTDVFGSHQEQRLSSLEAVEDIPLARPSVPDREVMLRALDGILDSRVLTNGSLVRELERRSAEYLGVAHCVAVSSCTSGLMLVIRAASLRGSVVVPSFTFAATAHAVAWNGLAPIFADIDPQALTLDPQSADREIGVRTSAILATHLYGTPCDVDALTEVAQRNGIRLFFDAAHAFGSRRGGVSVGGFGDAEVFSLSPTKLLVASEGGIIATNDDALAERCRIGRDYANPGDYDCRFVGLNARMSELHAAMGLASFDGLEERIERRNELAVLYQKSLDGLPGISFPLVRDGDRSSYKDFTILVEPEEFGMSAAELAGALGAVGIDTRRYYSPPVHQMEAYRHMASTNGNLQTTQRVSERVLTLPMWSDMSDAHVGRVADAIFRIQRIGAGRAQS